MFAESPRRWQEEDDEQKTMKESKITDMPSYAYKVKVLYGHHRDSAQQTTQYKWIRDTKSMTGNRLVLILKVYEP